MLLDLMDELGTPAAQTLMVGDTRWDLEMARNAGVDAVAVLCGAQPESELRVCPQLACLPEVGALLHWLGLSTAAIVRFGPPLSSPQMSTKRLRTLC
jgi:phosphoglycolate phosphatase